VVEWIPHFVGQQEHSLRILLGFAHNLRRAQTAAIPSASATAASAAPTTTDGTSARSERTEEVGAESKLAWELAQLPIQGPRSSQIGMGLGRQLRRAQGRDEEQEAKSECV